MYFSFYKLSSAHYTTLHYRGWDDGEMCKTQEVDQPEHYHPADEGLLTDEVDAGEDDGEEETEDWHHHSELEIVHQYSPH